jgi:1-deoxy-D-xylulose-5-phosphate synthase
MFELAEKAKEMLEKKGYSVALINPRWIKPLDIRTIAGFAARCRVVCTLEDHVLHNGFGCAVIEALHDEGINTPVERIGWPDAFVEHGKPGILRELHGVTAENCVAKVLRHLELDTVSEKRTLDHVPA